MLWIALHLPRLPLEAWPALSALQAPAGVVFEQHSVLLSNPAASALGIEPGMGLSTARSRAARLLAMPRNAAAEAQLLHQLALVALQYTPRVVLLGQGLALEVQASLRLFGGELRLWERLQADWHPWGLTTGWAAAPTCEAAALLAWADAQTQAQTQAPDQTQPSRTGNPFRTRKPERAAAWLDALPLPCVLSAWSVAEPLGQLLQGLGLATLGDLRRVPREGLIRRGAQGLLIRMDRAYGAAAEALTFHEPPPAFVQALELPQATDRIEDLLEGMARLMSALAGWLTARHRAAQVIELRLIHDSPRRECHPDTPLPCRLAAPETDAQALLVLFRERLERQELPAPVRRLVLKLEAHTLQAPQTLDLEWTLTAAETIVGSAPNHPGHPAGATLRLLDRLQARLGPERVLTLHALGDHRPERASAWHPAVPTAAAAVQPASGRLERPCWLLPQPEPLVERQGQLWQGARRFVLRSRPERIEAGWYDDDPSCRDYHVAQSSDARLAWVYRVHRAGEPAWFLHGWFA